MPKRYVIELSTLEKQTLERWLKNPPKVYLRDRARALLQVAQGATLCATAQKLRVHRNTVAEWVHRFLAERLPGLKIKVGRGRKAVFSPVGPSRSPTPG
jgi:hypothetical protein